MDIEGGITREEVHPDQADLRLIEVEGVVGRSVDVVQAASQPLPARVHAPAPVEVELAVAKRVSISGF